VRLKRETARATEERDSACDRRERQRVRLKRETARATEERERVRPKRENYLGLGEHGMMRADAVDVADAVVLDTLPVF
jgi:7-keto-8-aminopelargonate synthetase-like enzyme